MAAGLWAEPRSDGRASEAGRRLLLAFLYFVLPFVVFFNLVRADFDLDRVGGIALGWIALGLSVAFVWLVCTRFLHLPRVRTGTLMTCSTVSNTGYLGYPLVVTLLGSEHLPDAVLYDLGVSSPALLLGAFGIGAAYGTSAGESARERWISFFARNPPLFAAVLALIAPDAFAPDLLVDISRVFVIALLPVGFFAVGTLLAGRGGGGIPRPEPPIAVVAVAKLALVPSLLFLLSIPLLDLPDAYLILAAMPTGLNSMIVAHAYGLDPRLTAESVVWTTAIVIPIALLLQLAGVFG